MTKIEPVAEIIEGSEFDLEGVLINAREISYYHDDINALPIGEKLYTEAQMRQLGEACAVVLYDPDITVPGGIIAIRNLIKEMLP